MLNENRKISDASLWDHWHDAYGQEMRAIINTHADTRRVEIEATEAAERRVKRSAEAAARKIENINALILRLCMSAILASAACILDAVGAISFPLCLTVAAIAGAFCLTTFTAYITRNHKPTAKKIIGEG